MTNQSFKKFGVKALKVLAWITGVIIFLLLAIFILIRIPAVQQWATGKTLNIVRDKIDTEVRLEKILIDFPTDIVLEGFYLEDQQQDTLVFFKRLSINTSLWRLAKKEVLLNSIELQGLVADVDRKDSTFNFQFIIDAFAGDTTAVDTAASPWRIGWDEVTLQNASIRYDDEVIKTYANVFAGRLYVSMNEVDLEASKYHVDKIETSRVEGLVRQGQVETAVAERVVRDSLSDPKGQAAPLDFDLDAMRMEDVDLRYTQTASGMEARADVGLLEVSIDAIDMQQQIAEVDQITLRRSFLAYHQLKTEQPESASTVVATDPDSATDEIIPLPWKVSLQALNVGETALQYYNFNFPVLPGQIDYNHIWLSNVAIDIKDVVASSTQVQATINQFAFHERSGFVLESTRAMLVADQNHIAIEPFAIRTGHSSFSLSAQAEFQSWSAVRNNYAQIPFTFSFHVGQIGKRDILYFQPTLQESLASIPDRAFTLRGDINASGTMAQLTANIDLRLLSRTQLTARAEVRGLPDIEQARGRLRINRLYTTAPDVAALLPPEAIPESINIPQWMSLTGWATGSVNQPEVKLRLESSAGTIHASGNVKLDSTSSQDFSAQVAVRQLDVASILGDTTFGSLTANFRAKGAGLQPGRIHGNATLAINSFEFKDHIYKDLQVEAIARGDQYVADATLADSSLNFALHAEVTQGDVSKYKTSLELKEADWQALNLIDRPLKTKATVFTDLSVGADNRINGTAGIKDFGAYNGEALYKVDSLIVASIEQEGETTVSLSSDIIEGEFSGNMNLLALPAVLSDHFQQYIAVEEVAGTDTTSANTQRQQFQFSLQLKDTDLLTEVMVPQLEPFQPGEMSGSFDSQTGDFTFRFGVSDVRYGNIGVQSLGVRVDTDPSQLSYGLSINDVGIDTLRIAGLSFSGSIANNIIETKLSVFDSAQTAKYQLAGNIEAGDDGITFRLAQSNLLNYETWESPADNYLTIGSNVFTPYHFSLTNGAERIALEREAGNANVVMLNLDDLQLSSLTNLVEGLTPVQGVADGSVLVYAGADGQFSSDLIIRQLTVLDQQWGDLSLQLEQQRQNLLAFNVSSSGSVIDFGLEGEYLSDSANARVDAQLDLRTINLAAIQPLAQGIMKSMDGNIRGRVSIGGPLSKPALNGNINFQKVSFVPAAVNTSFKIDNETLVLSGSQLRLNDFTLQDASGNNASLRGSITYRNAGLFGLDLSIATENFQVIKSTAEDNDLFYGDVRVTFKGQVSGTSAQPVINMNVRLGDESEFTFVVPESEKGLQERKGVVKFVDRDATKDPFLADIKPEDSIQTGFSGMSVTANIELTDKETFNIMIDPVTGDQLSVKGNAALTFNMNPAGDMQLTGRYTLTEGSYQFSFYRLTKRNFSITEGSSITWTGDVMDAALDIKALYEVETSPIDLVSNQLTNASTQELTRYKQKLPFQVYLLIGGQILTPEIGFRIDMPEDKQNAFNGSIYSIIRDLNTRESDLNKQVFALLVLKRFISDNPFESQGGGGGFESTARSSVSKILTSQLNKLSQNIKGVELSFDVESSETYENGTEQTQTQLQLGLSKSLFDDRLVVRVSGNLDIEGGNRRQNNAAEHIGDLAIEYKLTEDGRFRITGFRNSDYDMIDGELIETGAGLIYIKDYNSLRELFKANDKK